MKNLPSLTSLRFIAAFFVFISHFPLLVPISFLSKEMVKTFCANGYVGVTIFFILSGFILSHTYGTRENFFTLSGLRQFYVARFARIYPIYFLTLTLACLIAIKNGSLPNRWYLHYFTLQAWSSSNEFTFSLNGPAWSIGVETFLYLIFPILLLVLAKLGKSYKQLIIAFVLIVGLIVTSFAIFKFTSLNSLEIGEANSAHRWLYRSPLFRIGDFLLGIVASRFYMILINKTLRKWIILTAIFVSSSFILYFMSQKTVLYSTESFDLLYSVPITVLILALALRDSLFQNISLKTRLFESLGQISFSFFLIQSPLGTSKPFSSLLNMSGQSPATIRNLFLYILGLLGLLLISRLLFIFIEKPSRRIVIKALGSN